MIIGIDPGAKGGMALLTDRGEVVETIPFDGIKEKEIIFALDKWIALALPSRPTVYLEKVGYIKGDGGKGAFTFGQVYGFIRGAVQMARLRLVDVYPMMWQARMGCMTMGAKNVSKNRAIALFPRYHAERPRGITHGVADAMLIAEYGRIHGRSAE